MKGRIHDLIEKRLLNRRDELRYRLATVERDMRHEADPLSPDWAEQSAQLANEGVLASMRLSSEAELREVESALRRLADGTYGICRRCGELIAPGRLYSLPHTDCCSGCAAALGGQRTGQAK
jgi:RNA polymerase-binding transcription factor DksA